MGLRQGLPPHTPPGMDIPDPSFFHHFFVSLRAFLLTFLVNARIVAPFFFLIVET